MGRNLLVKARTSFITMERPNRLSSNGVNTSDITNEASALLSPANPNIQSTTGSMHDLEQGQSGANDSHSREQPFANPLNKLRGDSSMHKRSPSQSDNSQAKSSTSSGGQHHRRNLLLSGLSYCLCSASLILLNKHALSSFGFRW